MTPLTYRTLVAELFPRLTGGIRWGLDRTRRMLAAVGDPHRRFRVLHVGGTNGKGSVAAHIASVLYRSGHRTGLYTSPHLCSFRERIAVDGAPIGEDDLLTAAELLWPAIRAEGASFFEATTAIAFLALADAGVDAAVVEVGLGGRLDATNVVDPDVTVLTNVSLDHVQLLGPTLEAVAREKAGIIKPDVPLITGETDGLPGRVFAEAAAAAGAPLLAVEQDTLRDVTVALDGTTVTVAGTGWGDVRVRTPLAGAHQAMNLALAVHALDRAGIFRPAYDELVDGLAAVRWPGRLQVEQMAGVTWILDVAHNVAGVEALVDALRALPVTRPLVALVGVLGDKDWAHMLAPLHEVADRVILTDPPTAPPDRRWDPEEALQAAPSGRARIIPDFTAALERAHGDAAGQGGTVLVTGSFHTVGDALAALGRCEAPADATAGRPAFMRG